MRNFLFFLLIIFLLPVTALAAEQQDILKIAVHFNRGQFNIESIEVNKGYVPGDNKINDSSPVYWIEAISDSGEVLVKKQFNIQLEIMPEPPLPGQENVAQPQRYLEETTGLAIIPYFPNIKWLNLYGANLELIEKKDVAYLSQVCGNGICQNSENSETCSRDCSKTDKDGYCSPSFGGKDPDCVKTEDKKITKTESNQSKFSNMQTYIVFGAFVILVFVLIILAYIFMIKRKNKFSENKIDNLSK